MKIPSAITKGVSFGLTSGVITTLGLIVGLNSSTNSEPVVFSGILIIAIADALSDAFGMHISQESEKRNKAKQIWESTFSTFFAKLTIALSFLIPFFILEFHSAIIGCVIWGLFLVSVLSIAIAKQNKEKAFKVVTEHLAIALIVIIAAQVAGTFIRGIFF